MSPKLYKGIRLSIEDDIDIAVRTIDAYNYQIQFWNNPDNPHDAYRRAIARIRRDAAEQCLLTALDYAFTRFEP